MKATEGRIRSQSEHTIDGRRYDLELQVKMGLCRSFSRRLLLRLEMNVLDWLYSSKRVILSQVSRYWILKSLLRMEDLLNLIYLFFSIMLSLLIFGSILAQVRFLPASMQSLIGSSLRKSLK